MQDKDRGTDGWYQFTPTNWEYWLDGDMVIDMYWNSNAGHDVCVKGYKDAMDIPEHIQTLEEAQAWAIGLLTTA